MGYPGRDRRHPLYKSFVFAFQGIFESMKTERNLQIHFTVAVIVVFFGFFFKLSTVEWLFVLLAIAGILTLELLNTAVERVVDLATDQVHPLAKQAKDFAAGAVLIYAIFSVIIGLLIFVPKMIDYVDRSLSL